MERRRHRRWLKVDCPDLSFCYSQQESDQELIGPESSPLLAKTPPLVLKVGQSGSIIMMLPMPECWLALFVFIVQLERRGKDLSCLISLKCDQSIDAGI